MHDLQENTKLKSLGSSLETVAFQNDNSDISYLTLFSYGHAKIIEKCASKQMFKISQKEAPNNRKREKGKGKRNTD